jgi:hypothetical protein
MPTRQTILFSLKENPTITRELWERFTATVRARGHSLGPVFRALMLHYIEKGLPDDPSLSKRQE